MQTSESLAKLLPGLIAAQKAFGPAVKEATNSHFNSKYCDLAGCWDACRDALFDHGLTVVQATLIDPKLALLTTLYHESGEFIRFEYPLNPVKADPQGLGACLTYARRFSLMAVLGLAPEDDDGNAASGHAPAPARSSAGGRAGGTKPQEPPRRDRRPAGDGAPRPRDEAKANPRDWDAFIDRVMGAWHKFEPIADGKDRTGREHRFANALATAAIEDGRLAESSIQTLNAEGQVKRNPAMLWNKVKGLLIDDREWVVNAARAYLDDKRADALEPAGAGGDRVPGQEG